MERYRQFYRRRACQRGLTLRNVIEKERPAVCTAGL